MKTHPIKGKVRQSAKTTRVQEPLEIDELRRLYNELGPMYQVMLLLDVPRGMRRGELLALQLDDIDFVKNTVTIYKSIWHQHLGPVKTRKSAPSTKSRTREVFCCGSGARVAPARGVSWLRGMENPGMQPEVDAIAVAVVVFLVAPAAQNRTVAYQSTRRTLYSVPILQ